jgi:hypothetical protein
VRASRPPLPPPPPAKEAPFGDLTLIERIGIGGMAEVFRAREPRTVGEPRTIVVKRMLPHIAAEPGSAKMFEAEARIGQLIEHENVVRVLGSGEAEGQPYLSLELVPGVDLFRLTSFLRQTDRTLPIELGVFVARELLAGLHAVHEARDEHGAPIGLVHGDVSPSNVLLSVHGDVKLADFGIAQARLRSSFPQAAAAGRTRGKLSYLAPEQLRGESNERRSDVFAASAVATELVIGAPLFARGTDLATLLAVRSVDLAPLEAAADRLPHQLALALRTGLALDPRDRYETAEDLRAALAPFAGEADGALRARLAAIVGEACGQVAMTESSPPTRDEITMEPPLHDHRVRMTDGRELGPWSFAQLVEAVTMGRIGADDEMRADGGGWRRIGDIEALAAHIPAARTRPPLRGADARAVDLGTGGIIEALGISAARRDSGVWVCSAGDSLKEVYLVDGRPDYVTSNVPSDLLGEFLVERKILERGELDMALAVLPKFDGRLGDTLSALGLIEPVELLRHIGEQVREKLLSIFLWTSGTARFSADGRHQSPARTRARTGYVRAPHDGRAARDGPRVSTRSPCRAGAAFGPAHAEAAAAGGGREPVRAQRRRSSPPVSHGPPRAGARARRVGVMKPIEARA